MANATVGEKLANFIVDTKCPCCKGADNCKNNGRAIYRQEEYRLCKFVGYMPPANYIGALMSVARSVDDWRECCGRGK